MEFFNDHRKLFLTALGLFLLLTLLVAVIPAINNQNRNSPLPAAEKLSKDAEAGKAIYISNGCVACHTQQVRNVDMDKIWGSRPGVAADYADLHRTDFWRNTATVMGTERTGPDLTNIGLRQPGLAWHLLHLYQPRAVVEQSIMPAYPWLFDIKEEAAKGDVVVSVPEKFIGKKEGKVVASKEALQLVAYLLSRKQAPLTDPSSAPAFLYARKQAGKAVDEPGKKEMSVDGASLYVNNCQSCHQQNGEGLKGAFPSLKNSPVVLDDNPELYVKIIMQGYDAREEFAVMPAVGENSNLTAEEVTAIMNHERTSWGNQARKLKVEEVGKIMELIQSKRAAK